MDSERTVKTMAEQLEALTKENERLKQELSVLRQEKEKANPVSFKERYAVKILNSLPDMLTVFDHNEIGIEVVSNEETNHVGVTNEDFVGMHMRNMVPPEAYQNIHSNMQHAVATGLCRTSRIGFQRQASLLRKPHFPIGRKVCTDHVP